MTPANSTSVTEATGAHPLPRPYPAISRLLHWLVAGGIVLQFMLGERAEDAAAGGNLLGQLTALAQHKSIGITVLGLAILRVLWRLIPADHLLAPPPSAVSIWDRVAKAMHVALYTLLFFLPLSGWLMSSASGYSVSWFNLVQLPDLISASESSKALLQTLHNGAGKLLLVLAVGHILAALKHWLIDKDEVMARMGSLVGTLVLVTTIATGVVYTWPKDNARTKTEPAPLARSVVAQATEAASKVTAAVAQPIASPAVKLNDGMANETPDTLPTATLPTNTPPPLWSIDKDNSRIRFTAQQAGAEFTGEWQDFSGDIRFAADNLENSSALIRINAGMLETKDEERDDILAGLEWFDSKNFTTVVFSADKFSTTDSGFATTATLKIRGISYPVEFNFVVSSSKGQHTLTGSSRLDRLALNLGTIEWLDTEWVGQFVEVEVEVQGTTHEAH